MIMVCRHHLRCGNREGGSIVDPFFIVIGVAVIVGGVALMWRPPRGRRRTVEEALEDDALRREQEANISEAAYMADRLNIPGRGRR
jgi:hypothetical protein